MTSLHYGSRHNSSNPRKIPPQNLPQSNDPSLETSHHQTLHVERGKTLNISQWNFPKFITDDSQTISPCLFLFTHASSYHLLF
jgi:hypothetical protein